MELAGGEAANLAISGHQFQHRTTLETGALSGAFPWAGRLICQRLRPKFDMHGLWFAAGNLVRDVAALNNRKSAGVAVDKIL